MKNTQFADLLRRINVPLTLGIVLSCGAPLVYAGSAVSAQETAMTTIQANSRDMQEMKDRLRELEAKERQNYSLEMDGQRKNIDWWFGLLAIVMGFMAIFGTLAPYLMARKDKEIIEQDKAQIRQMRDEIKGMHTDAASSVEKIHQAENELVGYKSGTPAAEDGEKIRAAVATVEQFKETDTPLRLRAEAVAASEAQNVGKAYALWAALAELAPNDANALFNAGYWAQKCADTRGDEKLHWLNLAGKHYAQALGIKPDLHWATNNWGLALAAEANTLAASNPERAKQLLNQAEQLLLAHADAAPKVVAYNLACVYGRRADVQGCLKWLQVSQAHGVLPDCAHLSSDKDLDAVRNAPEFIAWFKQVCP